MQYDIKHSNTILRSQVTQNLMSLKLNFPGLYIINAFALCCAIPMEICYCVVKTFQDCLSTLKPQYLLRISCTRYFTR